MSVQLIVGTSICAVVLLWLMVLVSFTTLGRAPIQIPDTSFGIVRFICTLAAGFGGGLFANGLAVKISGQVSDNLSLLSSGGGAAALALLVWLTFPRPARPPAPARPPDFIKTDIPAAWNFAQAAVHVAELAGATVDISRFSAEEKQTGLGKPLTIQGATGELALIQLSKHAPQGVRRFQVSFDSATAEYRLLP